MNSSPCAAGLYADFWETDLTYHTIFYLFIYFFLWQGYLSFFCLAHSENECSLCTSKKIISHHIFFLCPFCHFQNAIVFSSTFHTFWSSIADFLAEPTAAPIYGIWNLIWKHVILYLYLNKIVAWVFLEYFLNVCRLFFNQL